MGCLILIAALVIGYAISGVAGMVVALLILIVLMMFAS
tara:strand:- start:129 stop:242 length:114 start_codon:yes stop_codon:yes gene_type:complete